jgi:hypothetical protein
LSAHPTSVSHCSAAPSALCCCWSEWPRLIATTTEGCKPEYIYPWNEDSTHFLPPCHNCRTHNILPLVRIPTPNSFMHIVAITKNLLVLGIIHSRGLRSNRTPASCWSHVAWFVTITTCSRKTYMRTFPLDLICRRHIENPYSENNLCKNTRAWKCIILSYFIREKTSVSCAYTANISVPSDQHQTMTRTHSFVGQVKFRKCNSTVPPWVPL